MAQQRQHSMVEKVKTKLGFFVLSVLVVEGILGTVAGISTGTTATVAIVGILAVFVLLILIVTFSSVSSLITDRVTPSVPVELHDFCRRVAGHWWSYGANPGFIGFAIIEHDEAAGTLTVQGSGYDADGKLSYVWQSKASCISRDLKKLYYCWDGHYKQRTPDQPHEWREGFGEISFRVSPTNADADSAGSSFFDVDLADAASVTKKSAEFRRCTDQEVKDMNGPDGKKIALVKKKLKIK